MTHNTPPRRILPVLQKMKEAYIFWNDCHLSLPKSKRYSIGQKIDALFIEAIEGIAVASFLIKTEKLPYVRLAIRKLDTLKILLMILWETRVLEDKKYITLSEKLDETGKMLGGWNGQLSKQSKQNSPRN